MFGEGCEEGCCAGAYICYLGGWGEGRGYERVEYVAEGSICCLLFNLLFFLGGLVGDEMGWDETRWSFLLTLCRWRVGGLVFVVLMRLVERNETFTYLADSCSSRTIRAPYESESSIVFVSINSMSFIFMVGEAG